MTKSLQRQVADVCKNSESLRTIVHAHKTPSYLYDHVTLTAQAQLFKTTFKNLIPNFTPFYSVKINNYEPLVKDILKCEYGLDVASGIELDLALRLGCNKIIYYSPAKSDEELTLACTHSEKVTIILDSFGELERCGTIAAKLNKKVTAAIRVRSKQLPKYEKFGILIDELDSFFSLADRYLNVDLCGIHFHTSRNKDTHTYDLLLSELSSFVHSKLSIAHRDKLKFIDIGGGYEVDQSEGFFPSMYRSRTPSKRTPKYPTYRVSHAYTVEQYANGIAYSLKKYFPDEISNLHIYSEPGRIICSNAMHIALSVVDVKDRAIYVDGGVNMVGWQKYMYEYSPCVNITHPSAQELKVKIWGKLCTTWDMFGYYCYAHTCTVGDILIILNQGALTYSLAQDWIQKKPEVIDL